VEKFYSEDHATFTASVMGLARGPAARYCHEQRDAVLAGGVGVVEKWETERVPHLERLALGREGTC
jgi:hypothetical protein